MILQKEFPDLVDRSGIFDLLAKYINQKSQVINITALRDIDMIWQKHIVDSLMFLRTDLYKQFSLTIKEDNQDNYNNKGANKGDTTSHPTLSRVKFIDIGTGAGFPGLALAIAFADSTDSLCAKFQFDLLDCTKKKLAVIDEFINLAKDTGLIDLTTVTKTLWGRAEELGIKKEFHNVYDIAFARSVAYIDKLIDYMLPLVKIGGYLVIYKVQSDAEHTDLLRIIKTHKLELAQTFDYELADNKRVIYVIRKIG